MEGDENQVELINAAVRSSVNPPAGSAHGSWLQAYSKAMAIALPTAHFDSLRLPRLVVHEGLNSPNRRVRTSMSGGVAGARGQRCPLCRFTMENSNLELRNFICIQSALCCLFSQLPGCLRYGILN